MSYSTCFVKSVWAIHSNMFYSIIWCLFGWLLCPIIGRDYILTILLNNYWNLISWQIKLANYWTTLWRILMCLMCLPNVKHVSFYSKRKILKITQNWNTFNVTTWLNTILCIVDKVKKKKDNGLAILLWSGTVTFFKGNIPIIQHCVLMLILMCWNK